MIEKPSVRNLDHTFREDHQGKGKNLGKETAEEGIRWREKILRPE